MNTDFFYFIEIILNRKNNSSDIFYRLYIKIKGT